ncbi:MAG: pyruvate dehydrogenase (acetyl-transferring) E1 component subunit alpha [Planctomycetota bacterium]|nr:MAG: pyruvate dehydrogenase (acetyl-transferring) E1 component subunit alpha [Planctomycetota bacterium]
MSTAVESHDLLSILAPDGTVDATLDPRLGDELLLRMYRAMVTVRILDERLLNLQRQGRIYFYLVSKGQEACSVGSAAALTPEDWVVPAYRQPGAFLFRGVAIKDMVAQCYGNAWDNTKGRQMPVHYSFRAQNMVSISSPIGTQLIQAAGVAMAMRRRGDARVALTFIGDGGTSSNDFHSGLNFAAVDKAPVIFICENNGWAISCPTRKQTGSETFAQKAIAYGMPGVRVDGNDVLAVYKATRDARERALAGEGPTLLELVTYRMGGHSSSDDPSRYVPSEELEAWERKCPIARFKLYLEAKGIWDEAKDEALREEARAEVNQAVRDNERVPRPELETLFTDVYAEMPETLRRDLEREREARGEGKFP